MLLHGNERLTSALDRTVETAIKSRMPKISNTTAQQVSTLAQTALAGDRSFDITVKVQRQHIAQSPLSTPLPNNHSHSFSLRLNGWNEYPAMSQSPAPNSPSPDSDHLLLWQTAAKSLGRSDRYLVRLQQVEAEIKSGQPLSAKAQQSMQADLQAFQQTLENLRLWYRTAQHLGKGDAYLKSIQKVAQSYKAGVPLTENAIGDMYEDVSLWNVIESVRLILEKLGRETGIEGEKLYQGKQYVVRGVAGTFSLTNLDRDVLLEFHDSRISINKLATVDFQNFWDIHQKLIG